MPEDKSEERQRTGLQIAGRQDRRAVFDSCSILVGSLKMNTTLEYSTRVVQEGDRRCKKSTLNDLAYLTPLRIPLMNPVYRSKECQKKGLQSAGSRSVCTV
jgi:hypothetical protein